MQSAGSVDEFREVEPPTLRPRREGWPALEQALKCCAAQAASLLVVCPVAWLSDARFLERLRNAQVPVAILDSEILTEHALDALVWAAQKRTEAAAERSRIALRAAKSNGAKLGSPQNLANRAEGSRRGVARRQSNADERATRVKPLVEQLREQGHSYRAVANELERQHVPTERGGAWTASQVTRVLARIRSLRNQAGT